MQNLHCDHPTEEQLERFLLHQSDEQELETLETHILACESCVTRLEDLELQIAAMKLALRQFQSDQAAKAAKKVNQTSWRTWFTVPKLSFVGAAAVIAIGVAVVPEVVQRNQPVAQVSLSAFRGTETAVVPEGRRLQVTLNTSDLEHGPVAVAVVDGSGTEIWNGKGVIQHDQLDLTVPPIKESGAHFFRIYALGTDKEHGELLREFALQVK